MEKINETDKQLKGEMQTIGELIDGYGCVQEYEEKLWPSRGPLRRLDRQKEKKP